MRMLALILLLSFAQQNPDEVVISSNAPQEKHGDVEHFSDQVIATYQDMRFEADFADWNSTTHQLTAGERVRFTRGAEKLEGSKLDFNLASKSGTITDAHGQLAGFTITAGEARRLEDGKYELRNATVTACDDLGRPDWTFNMAFIEIDPHKSFTAKNTVFRFQRVPIFFLPYMTAPSIDRERQTGFLIPSTSTSTTKGRSISAPFYWAINRSMDATFVGEYFSKRGPAGSVQFRARPNAKTWIDVNTLFAHDKLNQGGESTRISAYSDFGRGYRGVADMNVVSSLEFRQVYEEGFNVISSPIEHSTAFLTNNQQHSSINFLYNRSAVFFADQPSTALRKFPALEFSYPENSIFGGSLPIYFTMDGGLAGVTRRDADLKTPLFTERFDLHPSFDIPVIRSTAFNWSHDVGVRETLYTHSLHPLVEQDSLNRFVFDYETRFAGPTFEKDYGTFRHVIEPSVTYRYTTGAQRFRETIVVDDVDLITNTNELEYALTNRFISKYEFLSWRVAQKVFFDPTFGGAILPGHRNVFDPLLDLTGFAFADGERHLSPLVSTLRIATTPQSATNIQVNYDTNKKEFQSAGINGQLDHGQFFSGLSYFFTKRSTFESPHDQIGGTIGFGNGTRKGISVAANFAYDIHRRLFQGSTAQVYYNKDCYGLSFEFAQFNIGARQESRIRFALLLKNLGGKGRPGSFGTIRRQERVF
jgi:LPS-assembly protein